jgi:organic hydroperoxide reductase OsmC/OhrA
VELEEAEAEVRASFSVADKYELGGPPGAFQEVTFALRISSPAPSGQVRQLVEQAERACHAAQSFRTAVPVRLHLVLNGERPE